MTVSCAVCITQLLIKIHGSYVIDSCASIIEPPMQNNDVPIVPICTVKSGSPLRPARWEKKKPCSLCAQSKFTVRSAKYVNGLWLRQRGQSLGLPPQTTGPECRLKPGYSHGPGSSGREERGRGEKEKNHGDGLNTFSACVRLLYLKLRVELGCDLHECAAFNMRWRAQTQRPLRHREHQRQGPLRQIAAPKSLQ